MDNFVALSHMQQRVARYNRYRNIFYGNHKDAWEVALPKGADGQDGLYIQTPTGALVSRVFADLLFGGDNDKPPFAVRLVSASGDGEVSEEDQKRLNRFEDSNERLFIKLHESALAASVYGDCVIELYQEEDGTVKFESVDPRLWDPETNARGNEFDAHVIRTVRQPDLDEKHYYIVERRHTIQSVEYKIYEATGDEALGSQRAWIDIDDPTRLAEMGIVVPSQNNPTGVLLATHIPNMRFPGDLYGISDIQDKESLLQGINQLTSLAQHALEHNAAPSLIVSQDVGRQLDSSVFYDADTKRIVEDHPSDLGKVISESDMQKGITRYLTWDGTLAALFQQRQHYIDMLFLSAELAPGILGQDSGGSIPESGRALEMKYARTLSAVYRRQRYWENGLKNLYTGALRLLGASRDVSVEITFNSSLAQTTKDVLEDAALMRQSGILSNEDIIRQTLPKLDYTADEIELAIQRINTENTVQSLTGESPNVDNPFANLAA